MLVEDLEIKIEKMKREKKTWAARRSMKDNVLLSTNCKLP
jgi:hypothetical protein